MVSQAESNSGNLVEDNIMIRQWLQLYITSKIPVLSDGVIYRRHL